MLRHRITSSRYWKNKNKKGDCRVTGSGSLQGFELFYCCTAFLEQDAVATVGTPDVNVDLHLLFAPCAFVGTCHCRSSLMSFLFNDAGAVDSTEGDTKGRGIRLVCTAGNLYPHFRHSQMPVPGVVPILCRTSGTGDLPVRSSPSRQHACARIFHTCSQNALHYRLLFLLLSFPSLP